MRDIVDNILAVLPKRLEWEEFYVSIVVRVLARFPNYDKGRLAKWFKGCVVSMLTCVAV